MQKKSLYSWFTGLIASNGNFVIKLNKKENTLVCMCTIKMHKNYKPLLDYIQKIFGGSVTLRSIPLKNSYEDDDSDPIFMKRCIFNLCYHEEQKFFIKLIKNINLTALNIEKKSELINIYEFLGIQVIKTIPSTKDDGFSSGFFDGHGSITINFKKDGTSPTITMSVWSRHESDLESFLIFHNKTRKPTKKCSNYIWATSGEQKIRNTLDYFKKYPLKSRKQNRLNLIEEFFQLRSIKAYLQPKGSPEYNRWKELEHKWRNWL